MRFTLLKSALARGLLCSALAGVVVLCSIASAAQTVAELPWVVTNQKASSAVSSNPTATAALVEDVLIGSAVLEKVYAVTPDLKATLVAAEMAYRNGQHPGVKDTNVATAINAIAKKLDAPAFAYTDKWEVRRLRMRMMPLVPALFARDLKRSDHNGKSHIREEMSPIEGVYLFARMIDQKTSSPDYQLTRQERREKWAHLHLPPRPPAAEPNPRTRDLLAAAAATTSTVGLRDLAAFTAETVQNLALQTEGGK